MPRKASVNSSRAIWVESLFIRATWRVKDGQLAAVLGVLAELMAKSTAEEGSLKHTGLQHDVKTTSQQTTEEL